jgi:hypothetical protein
MFESASRLRKDVCEMLDALRALGESRYAAVFDAKSIVATSPAEASEGERALGRLLQSQAEALLRLPRALESGEAIDDLFSDFGDEEFLLAVLNGKLGVIVACADAERLKADSERLLPVLFDRLLRLDGRYRLDERGRGLFFGSPRLDTVVIPRPEREPEA